jgi:hypothetical protein
MNKPSSSKSGFLNFRVLVAGVLCLCGISLAAFSVAAAKKQRRPHVPTPATGTVSLANPTFTYTDGPFVVPNVTAQAGDPICTLPMSCSDFGLTVDMTGGPNPDPTKQVKVSVSWPLTAADFDVYVYAGFPATGSPIATSASSADPEVVVLPAVSAVYTIRTVPFAPAGQSYSATVAIENTVPPPPPGSAPPPRYLNYPAPDTATGADSAGEPSIGVDWNPNVPSLKMGPNPPTPGTPPMNNINLNTGGVAFFTANLNEFRVDFDDCASPAKNTWIDVTSPTESVTSLDPIGFVDHQLPITTGTESGTGLGRVFQDQLAGASSLLAFSDDDGGTWTQSQGSGQPAGIDHQTVGGGTYAPTDLTQIPPVIEPPHTYPHQIYYASQDVGTAFAARSDDGGLTFGPGVPMWNITQCGGLHGHVKIGPDGTAYVPNKSCGGGTSVAVSRDNGVTWTVKTIHEGSYTAGAGDTDPSVGIGADNTLYVGYQNTGGHPHIAVSSDHGDTWHDVDVSQGVVQNCVFAQVIAGDGDRAAFGFVGTPTAGGYQGTTTFTGTWYFYIATTFDRGQTYTLVDATNGDPVQVGSICTSGTTCGADRNLLDFNDLQLDSEGRAVVAYADGCLPPACTASTAGSHAPPYNESRAALATVIRQSGGPRLLSAYDSEANCSGSGGSITCTATAPAAPRVNQVFRSGALVHLDWSTPDNGGAPLTGYKIYRKTDTTGTYALIATVTTGCPACKTDYDDASATDLNAAYIYKVSATNSVGESATCDEFPVGLPGPQESPCALPGVTILTDPTGDALDMLPDHDVQSLQIAEPFAFATDKVVFTLKMASLNVVPINSRWPITFNAPNAINYTVRMTTSTFDGATTTPIFQVGPTAGPFVAADPASTFSADGTITMVVPRSAIGNPAVGQSLTGFLVRIVGVNAGGVITLTPDNMPDSLAPTGSYTIVGNASCAPNALPIAALIGYPVGSSGPPFPPAQGDPPLAIHFDASGSSDPDGTVVSYTFDFGDGSMVVTQGLPTIDHTYTSNGNFAARLTVKDNRGAVSGNVAQQEVEVELPLDDVVSRKTHGSTDYNIDLIADANGKYNTECRTEGSGYLIIFTFGTEFTVTGSASSVTVSNGGTVASHGAGPLSNQYQVTITGATNAVTHLITLNGLPVHNSMTTANGGNATLNSVVARLDLLQGDTTNDRVVNSSDISQTKSRSNQTVGTGNFRSDVNVDGSLNSADVSFVKSKSNTALQ